MKEKIINGEDYLTEVRLNRDGTHSYFFKFPKEDENVLHVKECRLIGTLEGTKEEIELIMDKKRFFEWINKLKSSSKNTKESEE